VKLLRVLQDGSFQPLGGAEEKRADVRVLAATHQDIEELIEKKKFREDLFFRLSPMRISVPPLREREGDIERLVDFFAAAASEEYNVPLPSFSAEVIRILQSHSWPGNVRQLQNVIRYLVLNSGGFGVTPDMVEDAFSGPGNAIPEKGGEGGSLTLEEHVRRRLEEARRSGSGRAHAELIAEAESQLIRAALRLSGGHLGQVTDWLGISRVTLRKKMAEYGLGAAGSGF
jgi:two-component system nitrogen regulation response regulator GlnG